MHCPRSAIAQYFHVLDTFCLAGFHSYNWHVGKKVKTRRTLPQHNVSFKCFQSNACMVKPCKAAFLLWPFSWFGRKWSAAQGSLPEETLTLSPAVHPDPNERTNARRKWKEYTCSASRITSLVLSNYFEGHQSSAAGDTWVWHLTLMWGDDSSHTRNSPNHNGK